MIQTQELENEKNLVLDNIRELNEVPVTKCLSYIHLATGSYYTNLAYLKRTYRMILLFWNLLQCPM